MDKRRHQVYTNISLKITKINKNLKGLKYVNNHIKDINVNRLQIKLQMGFLEKKMKFILNSN